LTALGLLCAVGLVGGYALLGAGWLIWKTTGATQTFAREVGHAALVLATGMMGVVSLWTALTEPEVAERWFAWPRTLGRAILPVGAVAVAVLLWRSLRSQIEILPFLFGMVLFLLGFAGLALSLWPYVVPWQVTLWNGAADSATLRIEAVGLFVILPIVVAYTVHAYWVFRGKTAGPADEVYGENTMPSIGGRRTTSLATELHLS
jgi:cytochrome bd ubiquinol oxidase subunit II